MHLLAACCCISTHVFLPAILVTRHGMASARPSLSCPLSSGTSQPPLPLHALPSPSPLSQPAPHTSNQHPKEKKTMPNNLFRTIHRCSIWYRTQPPPPQTKQLTSPQARPHQGRVARLPAPTLRWLILSQIPIGVLLLLVDLRRDRAEWNARNAWQKEQLRLGRKRARRRELEGARVRGG